MRKLNFPTYAFRLKNSENNIRIYDTIRKKFVVLQPEEWVRQHVVNYLIHEKKYPKSLINVEKQLTINQLQKRYDVVIFEPSGHINILVECKAPTVHITQDTFDQIARYNLHLKSNYLMLTNGLEHYYCKMDYSSEKYKFLTDIPDFRR